MEDYSFFLNVANERMCQLVPTASRNSPSCAHHHASTTRKMQYPIVSQINDTETIFACKGIARFFTKVTDIRSQMLLVQKPRIEAWRRTNVKGCGEKQERRRRQQRHEDTDDTQSQKEASEYGSQSFHAVKLAVLRKHVRPTSFFIFGWTLNASFRSFAKNSLLHSVFSYL